MTSNQVNYWVNEEKKRSNRAQEALTSKGHELEARKLSQQDVANAMNNLKNFMQYGKRGDINYQYGINPGGDSGNAKINGLENVLGSTSSIADFFGDLLGNLFPFDFTIKI